MVSRLSDLEKLMLKGQYLPSAGILRVVRQQTPLFRRWSAVRAGENPGVRGAAGLTAAAWRCPAPERRFGVAGKYAVF